MISQLIRRWQARRLFHRALSNIEPDSIAVGFAYGNGGGSGVRQHLEAIQRYSSQCITLFPEISLSNWATTAESKTLIKELYRSTPLTDYSALHSHVDPDFIGACGAAHKNGVNWVHTYHTLYFPEDWGGTLQPWQERINRVLIEEACLADVRISISPWLQKLLQERYGIDSRVVPNGVDTDCCDSAKPIRERSAYQDMAPYILFSGSLSEVKNPRLFIDLADRMPDLLFVMIGANLTEDRVRRFYEKPLPRNLNLVGAVDHSTALSFTRSAEALVVTSHSEGLPTAVMQAMAMGQRVVVPNSFGCGDLVQNEDSGFLFQPGSIDDLTIQTQHALQDDMVGARAQALIRQKYAWPVVIPQIDDIYAKLLS